MISPLLIRTFVSLLFVLGLLALCIWALRRGTLRLGSFNARSTIAIETAVSLGERRSLVVVAVEGRRLLLGLSPAGMSLIADLAPASPPRSAP